MVGLAHPDLNQATLAAQHCLKMYNHGGAFLSHRQVQRFLSSDYIGSPEDPPLRAFVIKMASGVPPTDPGMAPLVKWIARFACIRMVERSIEGIHARLTAIYRRAPRASMPYLSVELRFENLLRAIAAQPKVARLQTQTGELCGLFEVLQDVAKEFGRLEKRDGFKKAVESVSQSTPCVCCIPA